jgi:hypothetical protein
LSVNSFLIASKVHKLDTKQLAGVKEASFTQQYPANLSKKSDKEADLKGLQRINQIAGIIKSTLNKIVFFPLLNVAQVRH